MSKQELITKTFKPSNHNEIKSLDADLNGQRNALRSAGARFLATAWLLGQELNKARKEFPSGKPNAKQKAEGRVWAMYLEREPFSFNTGQQAGKYMSFARGSKDIPKLLAGKTVGEVTKGQDFLPSLTEIAKAQGDFFEAVERARANRATNRAEATDLQARKETALATSATELTDKEREAIAKASTGIERKMRKTLDTLAEQVSEVTEAPKAVADEHKDMARRLVVQNVEVPIEPILKMIATIGAQGNKRQLDLIENAVKNARRIVAANGRTDEQSVTAAVVAEASVPVDVEAQKVAHEAELAAQAGKVEPKATPKRTRSRRKAPAVLEGATA